MPEEILKLLIYFRYKSEEFKDAVANVNQHIMILQTLNFRQIQNNRKLLLTINMIYLKDIQKKWYFYSDNAVKAYSK
jgi:hypothetical protein